MIGFKDFFEMNEMKVYFDPKKFKVGDRVSIYDPDFKASVKGTVKKIEQNGLFIQKDESGKIKPVIDVKLGPAFYNNDYGFIIKKLKKGE